MAIDKRTSRQGAADARISRGDARRVRAVQKTLRPIPHALASTLNYEKSYFDKLVALLLPLMEKLTTGRTASLLSPDLDDASDRRLNFSFPEWARFRIGAQQTWDLAGREAAEGARMVRALPQLLHLQSVALSAIKTRGEQAWRSTRPDGLTVGPENRT